MKKRIKLMSLLLSFVLLIASVPFDAFADGAANASIRAENKWCEWSYNSSNATLYINANGELTSAFSDEYNTFQQEIESGIRPATDEFSNTYNYTDDLPVYLEDNITLWEGASYVKHIVFGNEITIIDNSSNLSLLKSFTNLRTIRFETGSQCKELGDKVFSQATFTQIELPESLEIIGNHTFFQETDLSIDSLIIPDSVYSIGVGAFESLHADYIKMPDYAGNEPTVLGAFAFGNAEIGTLDWSTAFPEISERCFEGATFFKGNTGGVLQIPEGITSIGEYAFSSISNVTDIVLPTTIKSIGAYAFFDNSVNTVTFPKTGDTLSVADYAFQNCGANKITFPADKNTQITAGKYAFSNNRLKSLTVTASVRSLGNYALANNRDLTNLRFDTMQSGNGLIGTQAIGECFISNTSVANVVLPATLKTISSKMFKDSNIGPVLDLSDCQFESIGQYAFQNCKSLEQIVLPDTLTAIGKGAFSFSGLTTFTAPAHLEDIGQGAFQSCLSLETVDLRPIQYVSSDYDENDEPFSATYGIYDIPSYCFDGDVNLRNVYYNPILDNYTEELVDYFGSGYVASYAFRDCVSLSGDFKLPDNIWSIGENAFYGCNLRRFNFPRELSWIGQSAFGENELKSVDLSACDNLKTIERNAFYGNSSLKTVKLPPNLYQIGESAFKNCAIENLQLPFVQLIMNNAFQNNNLKKLIVPEGCTLILNYSFAGNESLTYVSLPASLDRKSPNDYINGVSANAFSNTKVETLIVNNQQTKKQLADAFRNLNSDSMTVYGYADSGAQAFAEEGSYTFVALDESTAPEEPDDPPAPTEEELKLIGTCSGGEWEIVNTEGVTVLNIDVRGQMAHNEFTDGNGVARTLPELVSLYHIQSVIFANGIKTIPDNFLYDGETSLNELTVIDLPSSLESIGENAFRGLSGIETLYVPVFVKSIGDYAFAECENLNVTLDENSLLKEIGEGVFYRTATRNITLPVNLEKLGKKAFGAYTGTENSTVVIGSACTEIYFDAAHPADAAIGYTENGSVDSRVKISTPYENAVFTYAISHNVACDFGGECYNGYYINDSRQRGTWYYDTENNRVYISGSGNLSGKLYFFNGEQLKNGLVNPESVVINDGITSLSANGNVSPLACLSAKYVYLPSTVTLLGGGAFGNCTSLKALEIPDSVLNMNYGVFTGCHSLSSVVFGSGVQTIPNDCFKGLKNLKYVDIGSGVRTIGTSAFQDCVKLTEIIIPDNVYTINQKAFYGCITAERVVVGENVNNIAYGAFYNLILCTDVEFRGRIDQINKADSAFFGRVGAATTGATVRFTYNETPGHGAFVTLDLSRFNTLETITGFYLGDMITEIKGILLLKNDLNWEVSELNSWFSAYNGALYSKDGKKLLRYPSQKTTVDLKPGTEYIYDYAFSQTKATVIDLPEGLKGIYDRAFLNTDIKRVHFPSTLEFIGSFAFANCKRLKTLLMPESLLTINEGAFADCDNLASVVFNEGLQLIGVAAFDRCVSLKSIVIPQSVMTICNYAFAYCNSLEEAYIWNTVIEEEAFNYTDVTIHTVADPDSIVSEAYVYANHNGIPVVAYADEDAFYDACEMKRDINLGYLGFCEDGHGDIEWLTVYVPDCENDGYIIGVCEYCSEILEERHITATGHAYHLTLNVPATATEKGMKVYTCENCGEKRSEYLMPTESGNISAQTVRGRIMIADSQQVNSGKNPAEGAAIMIDGASVAKTDDFGYFSVTLESGIYEATLHYTFGFDRTVYFRVGDKEVNTGTIYIIGCDFNRDGKLNQLDDNLFKLCLSSKQNDPAYLSYVDLNRDGVINIKDYAVLKACMGLERDTFHYEELFFTA